jgi:hypothetical protein
MDRTILKRTTREEQELATLRYWRDRPVSEKMRATAELAEYAYKLRGVDVHAQRPKGPLVFVQRVRG